MSRAASSSWPWPAVEPLPGQLAFGWAPPVEHTMELLGPDLDAPATKLELAALHDALSDAYEAFEALKAERAQQPGDVATLATEVRALCAEVRTPALPPAALLSVDETAKRLRMRRTVVAAMVREGRIGSVRVGRRRRVPAGELERIARGAVSFEPPERGERRARPASRSRSGVGAAIRALPIGGQGT